MDIVEYVKLINGICIVKCSQYMEQTHKRHLLTKVEVEYGGELKKKKMKYA